jgi:hypothetical protein
VVGWVGSDSFRIGGRQRRWSAYFSFPSSAAATTTSTGTAAFFFFWLLPLPLPLPRPDLSYGGAAARRALRRGGAAASFIGVGGVVVVEKQNGANTVYCLFLPHFPVVFWWGHSSKAAGSDGRVEGGLLY